MTTQNKNKKQTKQMTNLKKTIQNIIKNIRQTTTENEHIV